MSVRTIEIGDKELGVLQDKYPTLNLELKPLDTIFHGSNVGYCDTINMESVQDAYAKNGTTEDDIKLSLIGKLDLSHIDIGTRVILGHFTMEACMNPKTLALEGKVSVSYEF